MVRTRKKTRLKKSSIAKNLKEVVRNSYFHLLSVFILAVVLLKVGVLPTWRYDWVLFAVVLGLFGFSLSEKNTSVKMPLWLLWAALGFTLVIRVIPYIGNSVPLGYDPGLYKFLFEHPFPEAWLQNMYPLLFSVLMWLITFVVGSDFMLIPLFIAISVAVGLWVYYVMQKLFDKNAAIIAVLLFAVSIAQFQNFWFNYYKNMFGIILVLASLLVIKERKHLSWKLILIGGLIAGFHRPAFFLFGIMYAILTVLELKNFKMKSFLFVVLNGMAIVLLAFLFNFDRIDSFLLPGFLGVTKSIAEAQGGPGTFFDVTSYFFFSIAVIPFAITGFIRNWKKNIPLAILSAITTLMVLLQLYFHNRFIIYLDIFIILYAALGFASLISAKKKYGLILTFGFIIIFGVLMAIHAFHSEPLITQTEFNEIKAIEVEPGAYLMSTSSYYSPWLKGYVDAPLIAPGLFNDDYLNKTEWNNFWAGVNRENYLNRYGKPIYIFVGERQPPLQFEGECYTQITKKLTKYWCE